MSSLELPVEQRPRVAIGRRAVLFAPFAFPLLTSCEVVPLEVPEGYSFLESESATYVYKEILLESLTHEQRAMLEEVYLTFLPYVAGELRIVLYSDGAVQFRSGRVERLEETFFAPDLATATMFISPALMKDPDTLAIAASHEAAHAVYQAHLRRHNEKDILTAELRMVFRLLDRDTQLSRADNYHVPSIETSDRMPAVRVFDESFYICTDEDRGAVCNAFLERIGHPQDTAHELFASVSTSMRLYPRELVREFEELTPEQLRLVKETMAGVLAIYRSAHVSEEALQRVFPELAFLEESIRP